MKSEYDTSNLQFGIPFNPNGVNSAYVKVDSPIMCANACNADANCDGYGYYSDNNVCQIFHERADDNGDNDKYDNYTAGKKKSRAKWMN